jgi:DNA replication protein DnaC
MIFANPLMGSAAMDRLVHRASKIVIEGKSYRVDAFIQRSKRLSAGELASDSES